MKFHHCLIPAMFIASVHAHAEDPSNWPQNTKVPKELNQAHEDYMTGNYESAARHIKATLMRFHDRASIVENAVDLADGIQERMGCKPFPADWSLPEGLEDLRIGQFRREQQGRVTFNVALVVQSAEEDSVAQLQLRAADGKVIIDKQGLIGEFFVEPEDGKFKARLEQDRGATPLDAGIYFINIATKAGAKVEGYVILSNHVASRSPAVSSPTPYQHFSNGNPTIAWENFRSPEFSKCDRRSVYLNLRYRGSSETVWEMDEWRDPLPTSVIVGPAGTPGIDELKPGAYAVSIRYNETRRFGPVKIRRVAINNVPFYVD